MNPGNRNRSPLVHVESAEKCVESVLQGADLCHITTAVLAGQALTVAAVYIIALFDQNP